MTINLFIGVLLGLILIVVAWLEIAEYRERRKDDENHERPGTK